MLGQPASRATKKRRIIVFASVTAALLACVHWFGHPSTDVVILFDGKVMEVPIDDIGGMNIVWTNAEDVHYDRHADHRLAGDVVFPACDGPPKESFAEISIRKAPGRYFFLTVPMRNVMMPPLPRRKSASLTDCGQPREVKPQYGFEVEPGKFLDSNDPEINKLTARFMSGSSPIFFYIIKYFSYGIAVRITHGYLL